MYLNKKKENRTKDYLKAIREFKRILKPEGQLLITVPFGQYQNLRFMQQFDAKMVKRIINTFTPRKEPVIRCYRYQQEGWDISTLNRSRNEKYFNIHQTKRYDLDFAAAARSITCIKLIK